MNKAKNEIEYSVLHYSPSLISGECINLGVIFHNITTDIAHFEHTNKWARVASFDDELNMNFLKAYLEGIQKDFETNIPNLSRRNMQKFSLRQYIACYKNEFKFSKIVKFKTDDPNEFESNTKKIYLRYDFEKNERLSNSAEKKYIDSLFKQMPIQYKKNAPIRGTYNENIIYDFIVGDLGIKLISFKGKKINRIIPCAKEWAWNADKLKVRKIKTLVLYDDDFTDDANFEIVKHILRDSAYKVIKITEGIPFLTQYCDSVTA